MLESTRIEYANVALQQQSWQPGCGHCFMHHLSRIPTTFCHHFPLRASLSWSELHKELSLNHSSFMLNLQSPFMDMLETFLQHQCLKPSWIYLKPYNTLHVLSALKSSRYQPGSTVKSRIPLTIFWNFRHWKKTAVKSTKTYRPLINLTGKRKLKFSTSFFHPKDRKQKPNNVGFSIELTRLFDIKLNWIWNDLHGTLWFYK